MDIIFFKNRILPILAVIVLAILANFCQYDALAEPYPYTIVAPPLDHQNGGEDIFSSLKAVSNITSKLINPSKGNFFINQKFNLDLIGPGTNILFVTDIKGKNWGFAFSNGQLESVSNNGSIKDGSYPDKSIPRGKYPWPIDAYGRMLKASQLVLSNNSHGDLVKILNETSGGIEVKSNRSFIAGHIGLNLDGELYVGYTSASVNWVFNIRAPLLGKDKELFIRDKRALAAPFREQLHKALGQAFYGKDIESLLGEAPTTTNEVWSKEALNYYPSTNVYAELTQSSYEYLFRSMSVEELKAYIGNLKVEALTNLIIEISSYGRGLLYDVEYKEILELIEERLIKNSSIDGLNSNKLNKEPAYRLDQLLKVIQSQLLATNPGPKSCKKILSTD